MITPILKSFLPGFISVLFALVVLSGCGSKEEGASDRTRGTKPVAFVKNTTCAECHKKQYEEWSGSHHDRAMQEATEKTVLGNFENTSFKHHGITSRFFKKNAKFFVHTEGSDGKMADFEVKYTFGVEPLQQYLIEFPGGRFQTLSIAWDTKENRWFHLYPDEKISLGDPLHWTGLYQTWNAMCAECHSTNLKKNYDLKTDTYKTTWSEIDVSCQACHGPGENHLEWAKEMKNREEHEYADKGLQVNFRNAGSRYQVDVCARCHSRRTQINVPFIHGSPLLDNVVPALLRQGLYHPDGQVLDEVYVYGSFLQSKMYQAGVRCSDCHNPHTLKLKAEGNALCVQCHQQQPAVRFKTLRPKNYDSPEHHFHEAGSPGALCVNCHMPAKKYMVVDPRRDHSFRTPRPDLSVKIGTPNACGTCHADKPAEWAAATVVKWYGPKQVQALHYAEAIASGRAGKVDAGSKLIQILRDGRIPAIVRATAADLLRRYGDDVQTALVEATKDKDPLVRAAAVRGLERLGPNPRLDATAPLLKDPVRIVRIAAARVLTSVPKALFNQAERADFDQALEEFKQAQMAVADQPSGNLNLGVMYASMGQRDQAEQSYLIALRKDPGFLPARFNLANLYNVMGRNGDAERVLREGIKLAPNEGELYYSLGLLLGEENRHPASASHLGRAAELMPNRARVHYNHGLVLQHLDRRLGAETALLKAHRLITNDPSILQALAIFYIQDRRWDRAIIYAEQLARLFPNEEEPRRLLEQINRARGIN